jgi:F0F1-type ATP synthase assembly protein I
VRSGFHLRRPSWAHIVANANVVANPVDGEKPRVFHKFANVGSEPGERAMKDEKPQKREESPWVTVARYSEIGFMIPAAVIVGYLLGLAADHFLHTHWIYLFGIVFGAVAGFVSMIRRALQASAEEDADQAKTGKDGPHDRT